MNTRPPGTVTSCLSADFWLTHLSPAHLQNAVEGLDGVFSNVKELLLPAKLEDAFLDRAATSRKWARRHPGKRANGSKCLFYRPHRVPGCFEVREAMPVSSFRILASPTGFEPVLPP